jgi:hypothetical protein
MKEQGDQKKIYGTPKLLNAPSGAGSNQKAKNQEGAADEKD